MSMFDDIVNVYVYSSCEARQEQIDAMSSLMSLYAQYEALAPDWTQAPEWAQWCAIHANGLQYFYDKTEPIAGPGYTGWGGMFQRNDFYRELELPLGIDWRLCKWQRPEVTK